MKAFYLVGVFALVVVSVIMFSGMAQAGAATTVDGFVGVPWGASKQQVALTMAQRNFKQVTEGISYVVYRGTFADSEADLTFMFGKNGFYSGEADLLSCRDQNIVFAMGLYPGIKRLFVAKYGPPDSSLNDARTVNYGGEGIVSDWSLRTGGTSPAPARIHVQAGPGRRIQTYGKDTTKEVFRNGLLVQYSANIVSDPY